MSTLNNHVVVSAKEAEQFCVNIFTRAGVPVEYAKIVSDSLIQANLRGVDSHGIVRIPIYLERLEKGLIDPKGKLEIVKEKGNTVLVDGNNNFGSVVGTKALRIALDKAKKTGISCVGVKNSNHFGTAAYYALKAVEEDMILIVMSNASQTMPPTGGKRPFIGTNPIAFGVPSKSEPHFIFDMATSVVARGKIIVASQKGEKLPEGWAIDKDGNPTTDPNEALQGAVLPVGGPKGYGLSLFIDLLSGVLTGAAFGKNIHDMYKNWEQPQNIGHFFIAINIDNFIPIDLFKSRVEMYFKELKAEPKADGVDEIYIPGEIEKRKESQRLKNGIEIPETLLKDLNEIGKKYKVTLNAK